MALLTGRKIPFSTPNELRDALEDQASSGRQLVDEIIRRVNLRGPDQMPPTGTPLTQTEVANLARYLSAVVEINLVAVVFPPNVYIAGICQRLRLIPG